MKTKSLKISNFLAQKEHVGGTLSNLSLFRYASKWDVFLMAVGIFATLMKSMGMPWTIIIYSEFTSLLVERTYGIGTSSPSPMLSWFGGGKILTNATVDENNTEIINDAVAYVILMMIASCVSLVGGIFGVDCFNRAAIPQITRIRCKYFQSLMQQEIGWYDVQSRNTNFAVRITDDIEKIKNGIGENVSHFFHVIFTFVMNLAIAFVYGWKLALIVIAYVPIVLITDIVIGKFQSALSKEELDGYAAAANIAEEVLSGIRTVFAFSGEKIEVERYTKRLSPAKSASRRKGLLSGIGDAILRFLFFGTAALVFWFGIQWVLDDRDKFEKQYTAAVLMIVFFGLTYGTESIAKASPFLEIFATARGSATTVFQVIERISRIDSMSNKAKVTQFDVKGNIEFKNIYFSYPSRPDVQILKDFNLTIETGKSVALVGNSGNGKSTCLQLLQRFYDPDQGEVLIDGCDIRSLNIHQLRSKIALVGQEPVLFSTTIGENIRYGKPDANDKEVVAAARDSGAHDFISRLPLGYNTLVGEKGSQLSGGQKQRIAIARALIQNPKILLLDEATSALDYQSEKFVQETLDRASKGRTTIVVSHRLSAIRNADRILFIDKGQVIEDGTHNDLLAMKGYYYDMISAGCLEEEPEQTTTQTSSINEYSKVEEKTEHKELFDDMSDYQDHFREQIIIPSDEPKTDENVNYTKSFIRILKLAKQDWNILIIAVICAFTIGTNLPIFSIFFAQVLYILSIEDKEEAMNETIVLVYVLLGLGVVMFLAAILQTFFFSKAGGKLTIKLRSITFASMLKQECGWFDDQKNAIGALSARLSGDAAHVQGAIGYPLSVILQSISTVISGLIVAFFFSLKLSLVCVIAIPMIILCVYFEAKHMSKSEIAEKSAIEAGIKIATEACSNIRTVASLRQEPYMISRYTIEMNKVEQIIRKKIFWRGLVTSINQTIPFLAYTWALFYGAILIVDGEITYTNVIRVCEAILYGTFVMTQTLVFAPAFTTALIAADRVFKIIDREPRIQSPIVSNKSRKPDRGNDIEFKKIDFRYPTRPDIQILREFNLNIEEGKTVALVGPSGCGKSTCIQLLQRLYDPEHGRVHIGLDEISSDIPLNDLRLKLSIVSQEPVLFDKTIAENIAYGDNTRNVSMAEIIEAAKTANVHNFIVQLPNGYETSLGIKGAQLSGGQKQRIAIARALIRNPKILLLDEATSALDLHSEQVVQQALDKARTGRTCIIIAHRLSTVQNADMICVVRNGSIVEAGTHNQLLALDGFYTRLYNAQK